MAKKILNRDELGKRTLSALRIMSEVVIKLVGYWVEIAKWVEWSPEGDLSI